MLEDLGVLKNIKRFSGTSGGAIVSMMLAIKMSTSKMKEYMSDNLKDKFMGHCFHMIISACSVWSQTRIKTYFFNFILLLVRYY